MESPTRRFNCRARQELRLEGYTKYVDTRRICTVWAGNLFQIQLLTNKIETVAVPGTVRRIVSDTVESADLSDLESDLQAIEKMQEFQTTVRSEILYSSKTI